ncbi:MAG: CocE/NonD family hydrolase [Solirubrobacteraceae bacterium]
MSPRQSPEPETPATTRAVRVIDNDWIELPDGVRLAIRLWLPDDAEQRPVSVILDAVPYRRSDGTAIGDAAWGTYFAAHGFGFARVDLRGSGDSTGILEDEYTVQEQRDTERVIAWLADRPWSTGAVGMIGVSWGGFAALQMAARHPEQLRGVVPIHASDDRYADDVHYIGGCVSAMDMSQWATSMLAYLNQPPDPLVVGDRWRQAWLERLDGAKPFIEPWLNHQRRDAYWQQGSACEDYDAIRCPVFAVGGWSDGYRDMVFRVLEHVRSPVRGLIGPWGHTSPEDGAPGPAIGFLQECVRFFAASLDGVENGFFDEPRLISYMQEPVAPAGSYAQRPGRWVADEQWPSPAVEAWTHVLGAESLRPERSGDQATRSLCGLQATGVDGGVWCGDGSPADFALDQRPDDGASLCWDSEPLAERVELLGSGEAQLELSVDRPWALVAVRVCDVAADGSSTLIARGLLNLSRREGHDRSVPMPPGEPVIVRVPLQSTAYAIPAGHRIRLAVSNTYWPMAWPSPEPTTLTVVCGPQSVLSLPRRRSTELDARLRPFAERETGTRLASEKTMLRGGGRRVRRDLASGEIEVEFDWQGWRTRILASSTEMGEQNVTRYRIVEGEPLSATVTCEVEVSLARPGWGQMLTRTSSTMTCDAERFTVTSTIDAFHDGVRIHARSYTHQFLRDGA